MLSSKLTPTDYFCIVREKNQKNIRPTLISGHSLCYVILHHPPLIFEDKQIKNNKFWNFSCEEEVEGVRETMWVQQGLGLTGLDQTRSPKGWFVCKCTRCLVSLWITNPLQGEEGTICCHPEPWADSHLLPFIKPTQPQKTCARTQSPPAARDRNKTLNHFLVWLTALWGSGSSLSHQTAKSTFGRKRGSSPSAVVKLLSPVLKHTR